MSDVSANVPDFTTPIVGPDGRIDRTWWHFFLTMFVRTGGTGGNDTSELAALIEALSKELASEQAFTNSSIPNDGQADRNKLLIQALTSMQVESFRQKQDSHEISQIFRPRQDFDELIQRHGLQYDPDLHAVATPAMNGFLSAADKTRVDQLAVTGSPTFAALTLTNGQIAFPATQVPSANPNTLDDYEEGTFTPTITFSTPGNLAVTYSQQTGDYTKIGRLVTVRISIVTSAFTYTTASGVFQIAGLPFQCAIPGDAAISYQGYTDANRPFVAVRTIPSSTTADFFASGSGQTRNQTTVTQWPSGGNIIIAATITYHATN